MKRYSLVVAVTAVLALGVMAPAAASERGAANSSQDGEGIVGAVLAWLHSLWDAALAHEVPEDEFPLKPASDNGPCIDPWGTPAPCQNNP